MLYVSSRHAEPAEVAIHNFWSKQTGRVDRIQKVLFILKSLQTIVSLIHQRVPLEQKVVTATSQRMVLVIVVSYCVVEEVMILVYKLSKENVIANSNGVVKLSAMNVAAHARCILANNKAGRQKAEAMKGHHLVTTVCTKQVVTELIT